MSRYVDADKLIEEIKERIKAAIEWGKSAETEEIKIRAEQAIATFCEASLTAKKLSTADVVEIVRCKDCIYWCKLKEDNGVVVRIHHNELRSQCLNINGLNKTDCITEANDYCSYGERVEE